MKLASFFAYFFALYLLFVDIDPAQNTKGVELNNSPVETFGLTRKPKPCARSRFVTFNIK